MTFTPEAINATIIAVFGSFGAAAISYFTAKAKKDKGSDEANDKFRDQLGTDNESLRNELADLKQERVDLLQRNRELEKELWDIYEGRRKRNADDKAKGNSET